MAQEDPEFFQRLLDAFQVEAAEHVQAMSDGLSELEGVPSVDRRTQVIDGIYREVHSLKGASRAVEMRQIEAVCQALEDIFADWKKREVCGSVETLGLLQHAVDMIPRLQDEASGAGEPAVLVLLRQLESAIARDTADQRVPGAPSNAIISGSEAPRQKPRRAGEAGPYSVALPEPHIAATVRISTDKLDSVLLQAEEMLTAKLTASRRAEELREIRDQLASLRIAWTKAEPEIHRMLGNGAHASHSGAVERFAESNGEQLKELHVRLETLVRTTEREQRVFGSMVDSLLDDAKRLVMLPFSTLLQGFPRLVRELARTEGKEVLLLVTGQEVEIDKRILEGLKDPLVHILRNCVDHGIEIPAERGSKPPRGTIDLTVSQTGGNEVKVSISDDGRGIDPIKVKAAAVKAAKISDDEARRMSEDEALELVFRSEISTSRVITEISGRGLGLAIARENVQKLGGRISVESRLGIGSTFHLHVPVTLANLRAVLVSTCGQTFAVPVTQMDRVVSIYFREIKPVEGRETLTIDQRIVPLVRLSDVLGLQARVSPDAGAESRRIPCLVLGSLDKRVAFRVDEIGAEQEILVKPLGKPLVRVRNVAGATVLADGRPIPLLHVPDLLKSATAISRANASANLAAPSGLERRREKVKVLIAEDSITSRILLKNILEAAGYSVVTAVDGADALSALRVGEFGLVVSDVDMPRMDGFELTSAIRADARLADLAVVLVTARETREDRERGIDAGANAYIVKSSFDQSNLLDVIGRLV